MKDNLEIKKINKLLKNQYRRMFRKVELVLLTNDPMSIAHIEDPELADHPDEYAPETGTIIRRLPTAVSPNDVLEIVIQEFTHWFGPEIGRKAGYRPIADDIWLICKKNTAWPCKENNNASKSLPTLHQR